MQFVIDAIFSHNICTLTLSPSPRKETLLNQAKEKHYLTQTSERETLFGILHHWKKTMLINRYTIFQLNNYTNSLGPVTFPWHFVCGVRCAVCVCFFSMLFRYTANVSDIYLHVYFFFVIVNVTDSRLDYHDNGIEINRIEQVKMFRDFKWSEDNLDNFYFFFLILVVSLDLRQRFYVFSTIQPQ